MEKNLIFNILSYAVRAPSTHNSQPWLFKINETNDTVSVFYDEKLKLPEADNEGRDLYISIGCMLENFKIAAEHFGVKAESIISIDEDIKHISDISLKKINKVFDDETIFNSIKNRVNARGEFKKDENIIENVSIIIKPTIDQLNKDEIYLTLLNKKEDIYKMAELTQKAMNEVYRHSSFRREISHWMNSNISNKKEGIPGYALKLPLFFSLIIPLLIRYFNIGKILGKLNFKSISSAPLIFVLSSDNTKEKWIKVGEYAERLMLSLQCNGFQTSIYVGSIEIGDLYKKVKEITGLEKRPQFLFAVGHIKGNHKITPRHKLEDKIIN